MPKGVKTHALVKALVDKVYGDLRDTMPDLPTIQNVRAELQQRLPMELPGFACPSDRTITDLVNAIKIMEKQLGYSDPSWSLTISRRHKIPDEATREILKVWASCLKLGKRFTVRHAKWVSALRWIPNAGGDTETPGRIIDPINIYGWAALYAGRERAALIFNTELDSSDIDAQLVFTGAGYTAAVETGAVPRFTYGLRMTALAIGDPAAFNHAIWLENAVDAGTWDYKAQAEASLNVDQIFEDLDITKRIEAMETYQLWGAAILRKGRRWGVISMTERLDIIQRLAKVCAEHINTRPPLHRLSDREWRPTEILEEVDYEG